MTPDHQGETRVPMAARFGLLSTNLIVCLGLFAIGPALPAIRVAFATVPGIDTLAPLLGSAAGFTFAIASLIVARPIDRYGYRMVLIWSLAGFALAALAPIAVPSLIVLLVSRAFVGIASAFIVNASVTAVGTLFSPVARARLMGVQTLIGSVAAIVLFPLSGALSGIDWRYAVALDGLALLLIPAVWCLPAADGRPAASLRVGAAPRPDGLLLGSASLTGTAIFVTAVFGALYLSQFGIRDAVALSVPSTAAAAGSLVGSSSYVGLSHRVGIDRAFVIGLALVGLGLAAAGLSHDTLPYAAAIFVASVGTGIFLPNLNAAAVRSPPDRPAAAVGMANATLYGSMILFPVLVLPAALAFAGAATAIWAIAALAFLAALAFARRAIPARA